MENESERPPDTKRDGIEDAHYAAIGKVASSWAYLEQAMEIAIAELMGGVPDVAFCVIAQITGPHRKLEAILAILHQRKADEKIIKKLAKFTETIRILAEKRNRVLHDPWRSELVVTDWRPWSFAGYPAPHRREITARKKLNNRLIKMETSHLINLLADIDKAIDDFEGIIYGYLRPGVSSLGK
jgi:hypothetical protein